MAERQKGRLTDRQADTDRQTYAGTQTDIQRGRQGQAGRQADRQTVSRGIGAE